MTGYWAEVSETYHVKLLKPDEDQVSTLKQGSPELAMRGNWSTRSTVCCGRLRNLRHLPKMPAHAMRAKAVHGPARWPC